MGRILVSEATGERFFQHDDGFLQRVEEPGLLAQAGRQVADLGSGIKQAYGELTDQPELVNEARRETLERNRWMAAGDAGHPIQSMVGQALPSLATLPVGGFLPNVAVGAAESALDVGAGGSWAERAGWGAVGAAGGDIAGRLIGRVYNTVKGLGRDLGPRAAPANPKAADYEALGGETLAYQRMEPGSPGQGLAQRMTEAAEAAPNPTGQVGRVMAANDDLHRAAAVRSVGLNPAQYDNLGQEFMADAYNKFNREWDELINMAGGATRGFKLAPETAKRLRSIPEIKALQDLGEFPDLGDDVISGRDWLTAREALSELSFQRSQAGRGREGEIMRDMIEGMDKQMEQYLPDDALADYARMREQYKNLLILEKPGVISNGGQINTASAVRNLDNKTSGYGRTARGGGQTNNPETKDFIDLMKAADNTEFKALQTSKTAERLGGQEVVQDAIEGVTQAVQGNPAAALGIGGRLAMPGVVGLSNAGSGRMFQGALTPNVPLRMAGQQAGRSFLDDLLYPYVGVEDERGF